MQLVFGADVRAHANNEDVADAGGRGHYPHKDPQHDVGQQVLEGRDAVRVGLAAAHVRRVAAVLELLKVSVATGKREKWRECQQKEVMLLERSITSFHHQNVLNDAFKDAGKRRRETEEKTKQGSRTEGATELQGHKKQVDEAKDQSRNWKW